jgi:small subunit ribosomal protein S1
MTEDPWVRAIPEKYIPGQVVKGKVTKMTNFGVFVELEPDLEGLLHISELSDQKIDKPQDVISADEDIEVKILRVDIDSRKIGLSLRRVQWTAEKHEAVSDEIKDIEEQQKERSERRGGLDGDLMPAMEIAPETTADTEEKEQKSEEEKDKEQELA